LPQKRDSDGVAHGDAIEHAGLAKTLELPALRGLQLLHFRLTYARSVPRMAPKAALRMATEASRP